jgi:hypothetical protein
MSTPLAGAVSRAAAAVLPAIERAAERTGVDFTALFETARVESGFNPAAKARTSSATGLFQFLDSTWLAMLDRHGAKHGIAANTRTQALELRKDPAVASLMAAEFMAENGRAIEGAIGRAANTVDLYLAHFLGAGGATRFLGALADDPGASAASLFPKAAAANRSIFFGGGGPRTLEQVYGHFADKLGAGTIRPERAEEAGTAVPEVLPAPLEATGTSAAVGTSASETAARRAAQAAYVLLAGLGG